jgi:hypothetical protein
MTTAQDGGKVVSLKHRPPLPQEIHLSLISVRGWVDSRVIVRPEELCHWKIPMRPSGIEPATCRFEAYCLKHHATACPNINSYLCEIIAIRDIMDFAKLIRPYNVARQDRQFTYNVTLRHVRATIFAVEKAISITCVCVRVFVALGIQHEMPCGVLSSVACPALQCFSTLYRKGNDFRKKKLLNTKFVFLVFYTILVWNISHSEKNWVRYCHRCTNVFM